LMLPEQPMLHEPLLQDIPPLQEHPLQLPMLHSHSLQDISQEHGLQDQLFREHSTFQQPFHNSFIHHTHHPHHNHTHTHTTTTSSMSTPSYSSHESFVPHATSHFNVGTHHSANNILNSTSPTSLLLDNALYQHPYFFQHYYYPQNQELQELQQQQLQQEQQQELHRQELHRQELQRQRQELHRQEMREVMHRQEDDDLINRPHDLRHHNNNHHHLLNTDFINQDSEPEQRQDTRDILHPSSILQDPSTSEDYQEGQDHYQHFQQQSLLQTSYESTQRDHSPHEANETDYLTQIHEHDSPVSNQNTSISGIPNHQHDLHPLDIHFKQEYQQRDLQQREHQ